MKTAIIILIGVVTAVVLIGSVLATWFLLYIIYQCYKKIWEMWKEM